MKNTSLATAFVIVMTSASVLPAQWVDNRASTVGESYARGMSDMVRSAGEANLNNSAAAINYTEARSNELDNRLKGTNTFFEMRRVNREARAAERRPRATQQDLIRYSKAAAPKELSSSELDPITGRVRWPVALLDDAFTEYREQLEPLLEQRAKEGFLKSEPRRTATGLGRQMQTELKGRIHDYASSDYLAAKNFLVSLTLEASRAAG